MEEEHFAILNDAGLAINGTILRPKKRGRFPLIVIAGGFFDTMESPNVKEACRLLLERDYCVAKFDFTDGFGQSEGRAADITVSQRVRDLEHVVEYCKRRGYVNENKVGIFGIGLGAMSSVVLEAFHSCVHALALMNTPTKASAMSWTNFSEREMMKVKLKRYFHVPLDSSPVLINYTFFEDARKIDMPRCARNLKTPTLLMVGELDEIVNKEESKWLYDRIPSKKHMEIIKGVGALDGRKGMKAVIEFSHAWFKEHL